MPQIFRPGFNTLLKGLFVLLPVFLAGFVWVWVEGGDSDYFNEVYLNQPQPVPFSHEHHVRGLGIDCRYCHVSVEKSAFAGMPTTETCMSCHKEIWVEAPMLEPVRRSFAEGKPIAWNRVNDLPDFVYFDHSIHIHRGVQCITCHGDVSRMPLMQKVHDFTMNWCLDCHQHPEKFLGPGGKQFSHEGLTDCMTCHR